MGADVVRVEKREGGEDRWVQAVTESGEGGTFLQCNRNKRSLTLDTTTDEGAEITRKLVAGADIVVANMPAAGMRASGLDYETLRAVKPDIILASATAYGEGGPVQRPDRFRRRGPGDVRRGVPAGTARPADPDGRALRRLRHRADPDHRRDDGALSPRAHRARASTWRARCCPPR